MKTNIDLKSKRHFDFDSPQICFFHRLIDFGLARELGGMDKVKCSMVGTLEFMAPEVAGNM